MDYRVIRSGRRTVALVIDRQGNLVVRAPQRVGLGIIEKFILAKQSWITKHREHMLSRQVQPKKYEDGESFLFLGQEYSLRISGEYSSKLLCLDGEFVLSRFYRHKGRAMFEYWYRGQAKRLLGQRVAYWASKMQVTYKKVTITGAQTRWGSCSSQGTINFSWRLMLLPLEVIDYVVIHELAHTVHHNHSQKFWRLVAQFCPEFSVMRAGLRRQGKPLGL